MRRIVISLLAFVSFALAHAEVLTLDSCVQMALRNNREIQASQLRTLEQQQTEKAYLANYFPEFKGKGLYLNDFRDHRTFSTNVGSFLPDEVRTSIAGYSQAFIGALSQIDPALAQRLAAIDGNVSVEYKLHNIYTVGLSLTQPIYMGGKITAAYRMNKIGTQMARMNENLTRDQVIVQTHEAYSLLLKATEMQRVAVQYDSLLAQLIRDVENAERHGLRGHNEVLKVQVKKNEAELQVLQATNGIRLAQMNLCHYIGMPLGTDVEIAEVKSDDFRPADAAATILARPEYNLLELKSELARQKVKLARSEFLPQLGLQVSASYLHGVEMMGNTLFDDSSPSVYGLVSLTVPIWHGNEAQHKIKAAKYEYERTQLEQLDLIEKMNLELQQAANQLDESILELELARKSEEQANENLRNSRRAFDVGLESLSDLLTAQTLWQEAYAKRAIAESQFIVLQAKYRKACGQL